VANIQIFHQPKPQQLDLRRARMAGIGASGTKAAVRPLRPQKQTFSASVSLAIWRVTL